MPWWALPSHEPVMTRRVCAKSLACRSCIPTSTPSRRTARAGRHSSGATVALCVHHHRSEAVGNPSGDPGAKASSCQYPRKGMGPAMDLGAAADEFGQFGEVLVAQDPEL